MMQNLWRVQTEKKIHTPHDIISEQCKYLFEMTDGKVIARISCRRSHDDGHHTAHHHTDSRTAVCRSFHLPRVCGRFQRSVPGDIVLLDIGLLPSFDRHRSLTRAIFISLNPINNENQTLYLSPFFAALHRCPGRQRAVAEPASQRNEQRADARPLHSIHE